MLQQRPRRPTRVYPGRLHVWQDALYILYLTRPLCDKSVSFSCCIDGVQGPNVANSNPTWIPVDKIL